MNSAIAVAAKPTVNPIGARIKGLCATVI
jgi:hypothetical protein